MRPSLGNHSSARQRSRARIALRCACAPRSVRSLLTPARAALPIAASLPLSNSEFLSSNYGDLRMLNPDLPLLMRPSAAVEPTLIAHTSACPAPHSRAPRAFFRAARPRSPVPFSLPPLASSPGWGERKHILPIGDLSEAQVSETLQSLVERGDAMYAADPSSGHTYDIKSVVA